MTFRLKLKAGVPARVVTLALCIGAIALTGSLIAAQALAYEGPFCSHVSLKSDAGCKSSTVSGIRRAVGHSEGGSTEIVVANQFGELTNRCRETSCEVGTGYLKSDGYGQALRDMWCSERTTTTATCSRRSTPQCRPGPFYELGLVMGF